MSFNASLMNKATSSDPAPTPGYLFEEIAKMTLISFDANAKVVAFVATRLQNKTSHVKWKALLVAKHVAAKGAPGFKHALQRQHMGDLKQLLSFTGPPDSLRQDEYNARVRSAAAAALEAVTADDRASGPVSLAGGRMAAIGSDSFSSSSSGNSYSSSSSSAGASGGGSGGGGGAGYATSGGRMQGIGSEPWDPSAKKESFGASAFTAARSAASKMVYAAGTLEQRAMAGGLASGGQAGPGGDLSGNFATNRGSNAYGHASWQPTPGFGGGGGSSSSGSGSGGAAVDWNSRNSGSSRGVSGAWGDSSGSSSNGMSTSGGGGLRSSVGGHGGTGGGAADGAYEQSLVAELCAPGGARAVPPADALAKFLALAPSLDPELVGPCLLDTLALADVPWQARSKALAVCLALAKDDRGGRHAAWLRAHAADDLAALVHDSTAKPASLAAKARDLVAALGLSSGHAHDDEPSSGAAVSSVSTAPAAIAVVPSIAAAPVEAGSGEADLLGAFDDDAPQAPSPAPAPPVAAAPPAAALVAAALVVPSSPAVAPASLFGSLAVKPPPAAALLPPAPAPAGAAPPNVDLFGGLYFSGGGENSAAALAPAAPPAVTTASAALAVDPFDLSGLGAASPLPPPPAGPSQATAFDFMGSEAGQPALSPAAPQQPRPPPPMQAYGQPTMGGYPQQQQGSMGMPHQQPMCLDAAALYQQNLLLVQQMQHNQMLMQQQQQQQQLGPPGGMPPGVTLSPLRPSAQATARPGAPPLQQQGRASGGSAFDFMGSGGSLGSLGSGGGAGRKSSSAPAPQEDAFAFVKDSMRAK